MRDLFIACCLLMAANLSAQNAYIVKKDGEKIIVRDDALSITFYDKRVSYKLPGKTWEKFVTFKDLDYVQTGSMLFKSFRLDGKKKDEPFFVISESKDKKLLARAITVSSQKWSYTIYEVKVIDNDNNVLEETKFESFKKDADKRALVAGLVRKYFSDCKLLMHRLDEYDVADENSEKIMGFFEDPIYITCQ